ncbi:twin-arginine translocase TatA/TatE family subunit [Mucilaginibacter sp. dw_454]|uniref:twin-arginine translocase TatA/TatE family subunit n=1 Tax=Mucilaginibacter sp. dw_454 TaxID=2720079 RepID=UPI001BD3379E|nr:twin-arginine translocase TatA/TatE family subunit [Mucilaginibacter sp. dw_454]
MGLEGPTVIIILVVVLLLFGGKKIPELMKGLGKGVKEFKDAQSGTNADGTTTNGTNTTSEEPKRNV